MNNGNNIESPGSGNKTNAIDNQRANMPPELASFFMQQNAVQRYAMMRAATLLTSPSSQDRQGPQGNTGAAMMPVVGVPMQPGLALNPPYAVRVTTKNTTSTPEHTIVLEGLTVQISSRQAPIFIDANLSLASQSRYGLIGATRECGKSSLLKALSLKRDLRLPPEVDVMLVDQTQVALGYDTPMMVEFGEARTIDFVLQSEKTWGLLKAKEQALEAMVHRRENVTEGYAQLKHVYEQLCFIASGQADKKARLILSGLGFTTDRQNAPLKELSSTRRMVASLARALYAEPTLLLIDRPTNYLDVDGIVWLENYLKIWPTILILNCQDRAFIDAVCSAIIFVNAQKLFVYQGNFSVFRRQLNGQ